jgi:hypothetical protein
MQAIQGFTTMASGKVTVMKPGARNQLTGKVTSIETLLIDIFGMIET